ncbi:Ninjurin-1 [Amphibalanus amphitrite]|uniref:Ninjurin-1 n=1 Tax=Amphibalanus amphitrite TaxID=1232801 RepID=A0A6A4V0A9_AMPAM|nr:Ninjurin-1 [Amphibalanus amphitrite]
MTGAGRRGDGTINRKLDANRYATKKTIAQGMLDVALLTANASQLRYVLQAGDQHEFYTLMVTLISISIALQLVIGILSLSLNLLRDCRLDREEYARSANALNYTSLTLVFLATTANVLIAAFDVRESVQSNNDVQSIQVLANVALTVMDMVEKHHDLAYSLCRWRNAFNNFTMIVVGIALMVLGTLDINEGSSSQYAADIINNVAVILVFIITIVNIIIAAFSIENTNMVFVKAQPLEDTATMSRIIK